jgi:superoxide dismutase, Cu-Zn family
MKATLSTAATAMAILGLAGCAALPPAPVVDPVVPGASVNATLRDSGGRTMARATATQVEQGIRLRVEANGFSPGGHGIHIHAVGRCDAPTFDSAGPHWNAANRQHGLQNPQGPHTGDMPNLLIGADGRGTLEYVIPNARLTGGSAPLLDTDGAALIIHAQPDDQTTDPSGNSGARVACGVFT